jgi:hypothetical protein
MEKVIKEQLKEITKRLGVEYKEDVKFIEYTLKICYIEGFTDGLIERTKQKKYGKH